MKTVCAWCGLVIREGEGPVSHGICPPCRENFYIHNGTSLQAVIDEFPFPVLVVDGSLNAIGVNKSGTESGQLAQADVRHSSIGTIVTCDNARLLEGCGHTVHCSGCVLRQTIEETNKTGEPCAMVPAKLTTASRNVTMYVSTIKLDDRVFVKIDREPKD